MQPGLSTHVFFQHRLHPGQLDALVAAGAKTIEVFAARHHFDYTEPTVVRETASWFRSNDVRAVLHQPVYISDSGRAVSSGDPDNWSRHVAPNLNLISERKSGRIAAMDEVKRAIECAEQIPFAAVVVHLGLKDTAWDEPAIEHSITAIEHLKAFASPLGVRLLLENLQSEATTPEHLLYIIKAGRFDSVGVCLDIGHLHLSQSAADAAIAPDSGVASAVALLGSRIAQVHLHDNHGPFAHKEFNDTTDMKDEHLWPGDGAIDWPAVTSALATLPAATPGILEIASERDVSADSITRRAEEAFRTFANPQSAHHSQNM
ncbi:MAG TPA: sugar phosphate isomerase/epimerase family protein [Acidobacteriaceae bacterium]